MNEDCARFAHSLLYRLLPRIRILRAFHRASIASYLQEIHMLKRRPVLTPSEEDPDGTH